MSAASPLPNPRISAVHADGYRPALDGLRGLAAIWVLIYHCWIRTGAGALDGLGPLGPAIRMGTLGVEVFFVLSGCVLALRLIERPGPATGWKPFVVRRAARLFPAVWLALGVAVATAGLHQASTDALRRSLTPESVLANGTLLAGVARLIPGYDGAVGFVVNPVVWSLTPELLFSLVLVSLLPPIVRRPALMLGGLLVAGLLLRGADPSLRVLSVASPLLTGFPVGVGAALLLRQADPRWGRWLMSAGVLVLILVIETRPTAGAAALKDDVARSIWLPLVVSLACGALCVGLAAETTSSRRESPDLARTRPSAPILALSSRPLVALGRWSYGIYLWHFPIIGVLVWTAGLPADGTNRSLALAFLLSMPIAVAAGAASYRLVEHPARRWAAQRTNSG